MSAIRSTITNLNNFRSNVSALGITAASIGLGSVDNTRDLDKPISTATAAALATKAPVGDYVTTGDLQSSLGDASFAVVDPAEGDVMRYVDNTWKNTAPSLLTDGGNF